VTLRAYLWAQMCLVVIETVGIVALVFLLLHQDGTLSVFLSVVLALFAGGFWRIYRRPADSSFTPFRVCIQPHWDKILLNHNVVAGQKELFETYEQANTSPKSEYHVLRSCIQFTVIGPGLVYRNDRKLFVWNLDFQEPIEQIPIVHMQRNSVDYPRLYMLQLFSRDYELGLRLGVDEKDAPKFIPLSILPCSEFAEYWTRYSWLSDQILCRVQKRDRKRFGWKDDCGGLENEYFSVSHWGLPQDNSSLRMNLWHVD